MRRLARALGVVGKMSESDSAARAFIANCFARAGLPVAPLALGAARCLEVQLAEVFDRWARGLMSSKFVVSRSLRWDGEKSSRAPLSQGDGLKSLFNSMLCNMSDTRKGFPTVQNKRRSQPFLVG